MTDITKILGMILSRDLHATAGRAKRNAVVYIFVAVLLLTGYVAAIIGIGIYLGTVFGGATAAFLVALLSLSIALTAIACVQIANNIARRKARERAAAANTDALIMSTLAGLVPAGIRKNPLLIAALIAGVFWATSGKSGSDDTPDA